MSAPRLVSPILDGFQLNETISYRSGSVCCVVTEERSGGQFVAKILSLPASDSQMDALLMTGAFSNRVDANTYFKEQARSVLNEAKAMRHMATLGGFIDFDSVQVIPAESGCGFDIYMLSPRRESLNTILGKEDLTHLEALNMGLDLCAALTACRHAGYIYSNLKPENVFRNGQHFRIGDLGLMPLSCVNNTPLPERYCSRYSAPELSTAGNALNDTADVYALGMLLYQAYNGGTLPGPGDIIGKLYAPPLYADYEMAQIILRACALEPAIRWKNPEQMGRALTLYLQRNGLRNSPIIPSIVRELSKQRAQEVEEFLPEYEEEYEPAEESAEIMDLPAPAPRRPVHRRVSRPARRKFTFPTIKLSKTAIVVGALAAILIIELVIGILVLTGRS